MCWDVGSLPGWTTPQSGVPAPRSGTPFAPFQARNQRSGRVGTPRPAQAGYTRAKFDSNSQGAPEGPRSTQDLV